MRTGTWDGKRWTKGENKRVGGGEESSVPLYTWQSLGVFPMPKWAPGCTEQPKLPPLLKLCLPLAKAAKLRLSVCHPAQTVPFSQEKQWTQREKFPKRKAQSLSASPLSFSAGEYLNCSHSDSAQVNTGAVRRSHRPFSPVGLRGPTDRWADRPAIVAAYGISNAS